MPDSRADGSVRTCWMGDSEEHLERVIAGRVVGAAARTDPSGMKVWFAYQPVGGEPVTVETVANDEGDFSFELPDGPIESASIGALVVGTEPVDLEPNGAQLEAGEVVIIVDDILESHLRYSGG